MDWWMWLTAGLLLLVLEMATPSGFYIMFFGLGALTVGALVRFGAGGPAWAQWLVFTATSVAYVLLFRGRLQGAVEHRGGPPMDSLVGEVATSHERLAPGAVGSVELRGTHWTARNSGAEPIEAGQRCRVVEVRGLELGVQPE